MRRLKVSSNFSEQIEFMVKEFIKLEAEAHYHKQTAKDCDRQAELIKGDIKKLLEDNGVVASNAGEFSLRIKRNPDSVVIPDMSAVPDEFCRIKKEPDKTKIKKFIETNKVNWATFAEPSTNLTIARAENV